MRSSHILYRVGDLKKSVEQFRIMGFTVQYGDSPDKSYNALIWFDQGPFVELLAADAGFPNWMRRLLTWFSPNGLIRRMNNWQQQEDGWCDIALECDGDVTPQLKKLRQIVKVFGPFKNKRQPTGCEVVYTQTAFPLDTQLPLLMGEYRPNPRPAHTVHANGATSVARIKVAIDTSKQEGWALVLDCDDPCLEFVDGPPGVLDVSFHGISESPKSLDELFLV